MRVRRRMFALIDSRWGGATVELALCLPLLVLLAFGSIEASNGIFLRQGLAIAAYETAQVATQSGSDVSAAEFRGREILSARGIHDSAIVISPRVNSATPAGTTVVVTVTAPIDRNSVGISRYLSGIVVRSAVTMRRL